MKPGIIDSCLLECVCRLSSKNQMCSAIVGKRSHKGSREDSEHSRTMWHESRFLMQPIVGLLHLALHTFTFLNFRPFSTSLPSSRFTPTPPHPTSLLLPFCDTLWTSALRGDGVNSYLSAWVRIPLATINFYHSTSRNLH